MSALLEGFQGTYLSPPYPPDRIIRHGTLPEVVGAPQQGGQVVLRRSQCGPPGDPASHPPQRQDTTAGVLVDVLGTHPRTTTTTSIRA